MTASLATFAQKPFGLRKREQESTLQIRDPGRVVPVAALYTDNSSGRLGRSKVILKLAKAIASAVNRSKISIAECRQFLKSA